MQVIRNLKITAPKIKTPDSQRLRHATFKVLGLSLGINSRGTELDTILSVELHTESAPTPVIALSMQTNETRMLHQGASPSGSVHGTKIPVAQPPEILFLTLTSISGTLRTFLFTSLFLHTHDGRIRLHTCFGSATPPLPSSSW